MITGVHHFSVIASEEKSVQFYTKHSHSNFCTYVHR